MNKISDKIMDLYYRILVLVLRFGKKMIGSRRMYSLVLDANGDAGIFKTAPW